VLKISQELDDTYASFITNNKTKIVGTYDATVKRVYWAVQASSISSDLDKLLVLDLRWGIKPQSTFTTWSGGTSFSPTAILFYNKQLIRGDKRGYILKHSTDYQSDIEIDDLVAVNNWKNIPIVFDYVSPATSFGSVAQRKWVPKITLVLDAITNISLQIQGINDGRRKVKALAPIIFRSRVTWGDPSLEWGDSAVIWNFEGTLQEIRRFPAGGLRTSYKQIEITNASANLYKSDTYGLGTVNTTTDTLTLNNYVPGNVIWPSDVVGYYITFDIDDYTKEYLITGRTDSVITFLDPQNDSVAGAHKWLIRGYNKDEVLSLQSYAIYYSAYSDSITNYQGVVGANKT
jgi:hypothetical protein